MFFRNKFIRSIRHDFRLEILFVCGIFIFIHVSNRIDQFTGNQYELEDRRTSENLCPLYPKTLKGGHEQIVMSQDVEPSDNEQVERGGFSTPKDCESRQKLAVIIPFRNREYHLKLLLKYLHPFLQRQKRFYQIFVVEQMNNITFNKGIIMNVAFQQALRIRPTFDCFIFHDVDLLPENDFNIYECETTGPRHLSPAVDELRYVLMYNHLVGGVLALSKEQFLKVNGWSNLYWGWGAEDDDMAERIQNSSYFVNRPPNHIGRYKMIRHEKREAAVNRRKLLKEWQRYLKDGIKQIDQIDFQIIGIKQEKLFTHIAVNFSRQSTEKLDYLLR